MRGIVWTVIAVAVVFHGVAGWHFSGVVIEESFEVTAPPIAMPSGDYRIEPVTFETSSGEFDAWYLPSFRKTWVIHVHGIDATPSQAEFLFEALQDAGYPQLAITYRNDDGQIHDESGYHKYGLTERTEVEAAVSHARAEGADSIILSGFGAGGSHILAYLGRVNLDAVKGAILDSPVTNIGSVVDARVTSSELPLIRVSMPVTVSAIAKVLTALRVDVNWTAVDYIADAPSLAKPVLIHHGTDDDVVPVALSQAYAAVAPDQVTLIQVEGADHVGSYTVDPEKYLDEILSFLSRVG